MAAVGRCERDGHRAAESGHNFSQRTTLVCGGGGGSLPVDFNFGVYDCFADPADALQL